MEELKILFEDREILVAVKPEGVDSEAAGGFGRDMVNMIRNHLAQNGSAQSSGSARRARKVHL